MMNQNENLNKFGYSNPIKIETDKEKEILTPFSDNYFDKWTSEFFTPIASDIEKTYPSIIGKLKAYNVWKMVLVMIMEGFKLGLKLHYKYLEFAEKKIGEMDK